MFSASYLQISLETANKLYRFGWWSSVIGAAITLIGIAFLMWGTRVRDKDGEIQLTAARTQASKANERAAVLEVKAAALDKEAAAAKLEQEKLKAQLAWRTIPSSDLDKLIVCLRGQSGLVRVAHINGDPESQFLALQLVHALDRAGWRTLQESRTYAGQLHLGLFVLPKSGSKAPFVGECLGQANIVFASADIPQAGVWVGDPHAVADATILVGSKLTPEIRELAKGVESGHLNSSLVRAVNSK